MTMHTQVLDHLALDSVKQAFDDWRSHRGCHKKIPESLCQQVAQLVPHYPQRQILKILGINHAKLRRCLNSFSAGSASRPTSEPASRVQPQATFVKALLQPPVIKSGYQVEWQCPDGTQLIFKHLDSEGLATLIQQWRA
jgi:hypothetical protein